MNDYSVTENHDKLLRVITYICASYKHSTDLTYESYTNHSSDIALLFHAGCSLIRRKVVV